MLIPSLSRPKLQKSLAIKLGKLQPGRKVTQLARYFRTGRSGRFSLFGTNNTGFVREKVPRRWRSTDRICDNRIGGRVGSRSQLYLVTSRGGRRFLLEKMRLNQLIVRQSITAVARHVIGLGFVDLSQSADGGCFVRSFGRRSRDRRCG